MSRQAYSLDTMAAEVNAHAPRRSKISDGGIGDAAHSSRTSDHNPNAAGVWRARDVTHDPAGGLDAADFARRVAAQLGKHPALGSGAYVIWNRRIISTDRLGEGWRVYTGSNPHDKHCHVSVATHASGYDSRAPWNLWEDPNVTLLNDLRAACKKNDVSLLKGGRVLLRAASQNATENRKYARAAAINAARALLKGMK